MRHPLRIIAVLALYVIALVIVMAFFLEDNIYQQAMDTTMDIMIHSSTSVSNISSQLLAKVSSSPWIGFSFTELQELDDQAKQEEEEEEDVTGWIIWTTIPINLTNSLIATLKGDDGLYEIIPNIQLQVCKVSEDQQQQQQQGPLCPSKDIAARIKEEDEEYKRIVANEELVLWNSADNYRQTPRILSKIVSVTYWSTAHQQHVPLVEFLQGNKIRTITCQKGHCPNCDDDYKNDDYNYYNNSYPVKWDKRDELCKNSHPQVLPPIRPHGGACACETTCYTPEAYKLNTTWPWKNQTQLRQFHPPNEEAIKEKEAPILRKGMRQRQAHDYNSTRFNCNNNRSSSSQEELPIDLLLRDFAHHLLFIPEGKLIFCGIPKVGMSEWIRFFRYSLGAKDYLSFSHFKTDMVPFRMSSLTLAKAQELLTDPTWTKAVFFRDPAERLLSAYLDKFVAHTYTQRIFKIGSMTDNPRRRLNFSEFVHLATATDDVKPCNDDPRGLHTCTDPHWKPQLLTCGLDYYLSEFDFIGNFAHVGEHSKLLLEQVGMWDTFGKQFDDGKGTKKRLDFCSIPPPVRDNNNFTTAGFNQEGTSTGHSHSTNSKSKLDEYYTPELYQKVKDAYKWDYQIWEDLKQRPVNEVAKGKDLELVKSSCRQPQQQKNADFSDHKLQELSLHDKQKQQQQTAASDGSWIIWTTVNMTFPMIATLKGDDGLYEIIPNVQLHACYSEQKQGQEQKQGSLCPSRDISAEIKEDEEYKQISANEVTLWIPNADHRQTVGIFFKIDSVTYWSATHQQYVPLLKSKGQNNIRIMPCQEGHCPNCDEYNKDNSHEKYLYKWDKYDEFCKSSHPELLPPIRQHGGACSCETTCFTPEVNKLNTTWPWKNQAQLEFFHPPNEIDLKEKEAGTLGKGMRQRKKHTYNTRFNCNRSQALPIYLHRNFEHHLFFIPEGKLILCGIPKVGMSEWMKFFRYSLGAQDYLSLPHFKTDMVPFRISKLTLSKAQELLTDPTWTKAVFFRDPAERLLSAYLDKFIGNTYTQNIFKIGNKTDIPLKRLNFSEFVHLATADVKPCDNDPRGLHTCTDPHWRPQLLTCGLDYYLSEFDFIGNFAYMGEHSKMLLKQVGMWDTYGQQFDDGKGTKKRFDFCAIPPPQRDDNFTAPGFNQKGTSKGHSHSTNSKSKLDEYYTPELYQKVKDAYKWDYQIWEDLKQRPVDEVAAGRDLDIVKSSCQQSQRSVQV